LDRKTPKWGETQQGWCHGFYPPPTFVCLGSTGNRTLHSFHYFSYGVQYIYMLICSKWNCLTSTLQNNLSECEVEVEFCCTWGTGRKSEGNTVPTPPLAPPMEPCYIPTHKPTPLSQSQLPVHTISACTENVNMVSNNNILLLTYTVSQKSHNYFCYKHVSQFLVIIDVFRNKLYIL